MLKAPNKNRISGDLRLVKRIAQETRVETLARLHASAEGLSTKQANINREEYGANEIVKTNTSKWHFFIKSFLTPFTIALLILAVLLIVLDAIPSDQSSVSTITIILIMVVLAGVIRFFQNLKTSDAIENLIEMVSVTTNVKRDGENQELPTNEVVVGDIINLSAGDMVPADMKLLRSKDLFCLTSSIDGKFEPREKIATKIPRFKQAENYLNYPNILYEGTTVLSGSGVGVVFATGSHTMFGRMLRDENRKKIRRTTFNIGIKSITKLLLIMMITVSVLLFIINSLTKRNLDIALVFAIAAAATLLPEMLPTIVTANLVRGSKEMAKHGSVVKKLNSVQNFGSADVLCTDKTGILTQDKVMLERHYDLTMRENQEILQMAYLNSYYQTGMKDLIDEAVIDAAGDELDVNEIQRDYNKIDEIPFDYTRRRMSVVVANSDQEHGEHLLVTKGAAEEMLKVSTKVELNGKILPLTEVRKKLILEQVDDMNDDGMRVLLLGYKRNPAPVGEFSVADEKDLTLVGFLTFLDPPKESARVSLAKLKRDGITVKILTEDNEAVTRALGLQVGLNVDVVYSADDLKNKNATEFAEMVEECNIFVELTPELKTKIIQALRQNGHVVSYMGDKINDAPAMRAANVGVSVDHAVDIAKESADVILLHKDLLVLEESIRIGRNILGNIMKYFKILLTSNFGMAFSLIIASLFLPFLPLTPFQLVVLNLIFAISCLAIPYDKMSSEYLDKPRNWRIKQLPKFMVTFGSVTTLFDVLTFMVLFFVICPHLMNGSYASLSTSGKNAFAAFFSTGWFIESLWLQELIIHVLRDGKFPFIRQHATSTVIAATLLAALIGTMLAYSNLSGLFHFAELPTAYLWFILVMMVLYILVVSVVKYFYLKKKKFLI